MEGDVLARCAVSSPPYGKSGIGIDWNSTLGRAMSLWPRGRTSAAVLRGCWLYIPTGDISVACRWIAVVRFLLFHMAWVTFPHAGHEQCEVFSIRSWSEKRDAAVNYVQTPMRWGFSSMNASSGIGFSTGMNWCNSTDLSGAMLIDAQLRI